MKAAISLSFSTIVIAIVAILFLVVMITFIGGKFNSMLQSIGTFGDNVNDQLDEAGDQVLSDLGTSSEQSADSDQG